jgi:hypothetical protein
LNSSNLNFHSSVQGECKTNFYISCQINIMTDASNLLVNGDVD